MTLGAPGKILSQALRNEKQGLGGGHIFQAKEMPQANFRAGRARGQALGMEISGEGDWGTGAR